MDMLILDKMAELERRFYKKGYHDLLHYIRDHFQLERVIIESILFNNKRIYRSDYKYNHLLFIIAALTLEKQEEYIEMTLVPKHEDDIEHVRVHVYFVE
jgi:hypothetical protein